MCIVHKTLHFPVNDIIVQKVSLYAINHQIFKRLYQSCKYVNCDCILENRPY